VPLRTAEPDGKSIRLWTARIRATGPRSEIPCFTSMAGPGIATVDSILLNLAESRTMPLLRRLLISAAGDRPNGICSTRQVCWQLNFYNDTDWCVAASRVKGKAIKLIA
jgi:hypothetical protein